MTALHILSVAVLVVAVALYICARHDHSKLRHH